MDILDAVYKTKIPNKSVMRGARIADLREKLSVATETAITELVTLLNDKKLAPKERLMAIKLTLDYTLPKPTEPVQITSDTIDRLTEALVPITDAEVTAAELIRTEETN